MKDLLTLPGVGRKTANVVLGNGFGIPGITVDTHSGDSSAASDGPLRPTGQGRSRRRCPVSARDWTQLCHNVIWHGRRRCHARNPACGACPIARWCPSYGEGETDPIKAAKLVREPRG